eukprot:1159872-Pelagomonas_calceolata.AAC.4
MQERDIPGNLVPRASKLTIAVCAKACEECKAVQRVLLSKMKVNVPDIIRIDIMHKRNMVLVKTNENKPAASLVVPWLAHPFLGKKWPFTAGGSACIKESPITQQNARHASHRPPINLIQISVDASCWTAPGDVLRSPGDAAVAMRCHFLHRLAHPSQWVTPPARSPRKI